jgi:predicted nucleic acid-binding protein
MTRRKGLVLDANILLRAVFGVRVLALLETYEEEVSFYSPDVCFDDARKYIPEIAKRRRIDPALGLSVLDQVSDIVQSVDRSLYEEYEKVARERVLPRDPDDWPIVSVALLLDFPIWTEDQDFFGSGVSTWTTDRVDLYLRAD